MRSGPTRDRKSVPALGEVVDEVEDLAQATADPVQGAHNDDGVGASSAIGCVITIVIGQQRLPWRDATCPNAARATPFVSRLSGNCWYAGGAGRP